MPENEPLLEELCKTFNMKKEDKREFVIRAHIIEAKGIEEALRTVFSQNVMSTELSPTVRVSWIKGNYKCTRLCQEHIQRYDQKRQPYL